VDIGVLGALSVTENGASVTPTAPKPRQVLALLAVRAGQVVPVSALTEELWGDRPPRSARTTLQTYVLQLRELITAALGQESGPDARTVAKDVLVTEPGGYLLNTLGGTSDAAEFERLAGIGYRAMDAGDHVGGARCLHEALALWRGPAFADVRCGTQLQTEARRLEEIRLCALDRRIDADLRLGRHRELLGEMSVLVSHYRTHESLHGQFMLALHRSGRRSEALQVYQRLRTTLSKELGLEPSAALRRIQRSILMPPPDTLRPGATTGDEQHLTRVG
jgi:DNA-binding SARP family transcriptional activator